MNVKHFTLLLSFLLQCFILNAQEKTVTGTVTTTEDGLPLPGATVLVKNTSRGLQTDFDGKFSITVNIGDVLIISYVGMKTTEVKIGAADTYDITLEMDNTLDEVVVVGYGTTTKQSFTGTATVIDSEKIENKNFSNLSQSLAGEAAGVSVINTSGQPGSTSTVRIRGFGSIEGNRAPLYVVDGVPYSGSLNAINPSDIKSTTILKDAAATAIYGSRGANGVIVITTKKGSNNESYVEVDLRTGINDQLIPRYDVITSPEESIGLIWEAKVNRERLLGDPDPVATANARLFNNSAQGYLPTGYNMWNVNNGAELIDPLTAQVRSGVTRRYTPIKYEDAAFNSAFRTEANLRMGGGNEKSNYFISAGFLDDNGYAINTGYKRYTTRMNLNSDLKDWLSIGANLGYTYSESIQNGQADGAENLFEFADKMLPIFPVFLRDDNYDLVPDPVFGGFQYDYGSNSGFRDRPNSNNLNPIARSLYDFNGSDRHELVASFNVNLKLAKNLTFESRFGAQYSNNVFKAMGNQFYGVATANEGDLFQSNDNSLTTNFLKLLRYRNSWGKHSVEALAAHESNEFTFSRTTAFKAKAVMPRGLELSNYIVNLAPPTGRTTSRTLESYFAQLNYDYDNKYFLTGTVRRDGSSRFAKNKWDTFGSIGAAWVISNEDFLSDNNLIQYLKLKGSYGITGDEQGVNPFTGINLFAVTNVGGNFSVSPEVFNNPDLTWETAKQYQVGLESSVGSFLDFSLDYFIKDTENLFYDRRISPASGVAILRVNDGVLRNSGLEFDLTGHLVNRTNFKLDLNVNGAIFNNEIKTMPISPDTGQPALFQDIGIYGYSEGSSIFDFYMREYAGVDPADGLPMWYEYYDDINNNGVLDAGEELRNNTDIQDGSLTPYLNAVPDANIRKTVTKNYENATDKYINRSGIPDVSGAFRLNAKIHNFNISTQFTYSIGGYAYDFQYSELMHDNNGGILATNRHTDVRNRWRQPGDVTDVPLIADRVIENVNSISTRFITKTDFLALNNILISYDFPSKFLDDTMINGLNIYVSGDNLMFNGVREGFNPTTSEDGNSDRGLYAPLSTFTLGLKVKF